MTVDDKIDMGAFLTRIAKSDMTPASADTVERIKQKLEAKQQEEVERKINAIYSATQRWVTELRQNKQRRLEIKAELQKLEKQANDVLAGKL